MLTKLGRTARYAAALGLLGGCSDGTEFTLYRNSVLDDTARIHVASFNAQDGETYNRGNCETARTLFEQQPGVKTAFWCEKGRFRK